MRNWCLLIRAYVLALIVACIAARIEWLNWEAGGISPNREYFDGDPANGVVKWRVSVATNEVRWRQVHLRDDRGRAFERDLTQSERARMLSDIRRNQANGRLRSFVASAGLLQYLLVPTLAGATVLTARRHGPALASPLGAIALGATVLMLYRAYFTSLGW